MTTVKHHPITFRQIRQDHFLVEKDGRRVGTLCQTPAWAERNANRWRYWPEGQPPTPYFRNLEEAQEAIGDMH